MDNASGKLFMKQSSISLSPTIDLAVLYSSLLFTNRSYYCISIDLTIIYISKPCDLLIKTYVTTLASALLKNHADIIRAAVGDTSHVVDILAL